MTLLATPAKTSCRSGAGTSRGSMEQAATRSLALSSTCRPTTSSSMPATRRSSRATAAQLQLRSSGMLVTRLTGRGASGFGSVSTPCPNPESCICFIKLLREECLRMWHDLFCVDSSRGREARAPRPTQPKETGARANRRSKETAETRRKRETSYLQCGFGSDGLFDTSHLVYGTGSTS